MFLNSKKIYKIYYLDNYELFFSNLNKKEMSNEDISKNIEDFKKIIYQEKSKRESEKEKNENVYNISINDKERKDEIENREIIYHKNNNIISFAGSYGVGKSITSILLAKYISKKYKVLLIDCDYFNKSINTMLGISKLPKNYREKNLLEAIIKYKNNLYILSSLDLFTNNFEITNTSALINCLEELKREFDFIIIDTSSDLLDIKNNIIFSYSSEIVFLIEPNLSEVKKSNIYLEKIIRDYEIEESKINIIFNKVNKYKINSKILNEIYSENNIMGEIEYNPKYNLIINKNNFKAEDYYETLFTKILDNIE